MGEVIAVTSGKGGVGKSTTTASIGICFARMGKRVLLIDTDIGLRNLDVILGMENRIVYDVIDVIDGIVQPSQAILCVKQIPGLFLLPAAQTKSKDELTDHGMIGLCNRLKNEYDYVIIDSPAGVEQGFSTAISGAQSAIVVVTPELTSVRDAERTIGILEANADIPAERIHLIINRMREKLLKKGLVMSPEDIISILGAPLSGIIPEDDAVLTATATGGMTACNSHSIAQMAYFNTTRRLLGEDVPLMNIKKERRNRLLRHIFRMEGK